MVFLWLLPALRLARLHQCERAHYGAAIRRDPAWVEQARAFRAWAAGYDDNSCGGTRTLANHTAWLQSFTCPVLELRGDLTVAERINQVQKELRTLGLR